MIVGGKTNLKLLPNEVCYYHTLVIMFSIRNHKYLINHEYIMYHNQANKKNIVEQLVEIKIIDNALLHTTKFLRNKRNALTQSQHQVSMVNQNART